jgi:hypothetical protein
VLHRYLRFANRNGKLEKMIYEVEVDEGS